ncbi:MAG: hypothetical protein JOZ41_19025 [Chloroflexi bacterium]|nr:hypothetical protein [Chloroflexota bacterium]
MNLLRVAHGRSLPDVLTRDFSVARFDVIADLNNEDLYFVQLKSDQGAVVGALAYRMGWFKPRSVSALTDRLGVHPAPRMIADAYRNDPKQTIGTFTSTLPS